MRQMNIFSLAIGLAAGAVAMYYLDARTGARRRALVRDKLIAAGHDVADFAEAKGKRAGGRLKGVLATHRLDRVSHRKPESDQQLHDRIRARLGHVTTHPRSIHVAVDQGRVCLTGHILASELGEVVKDVKRMAGVKSIDNQLTCHDSPAGIPELQGSGWPRGAERRAAAAWH